MQIEKITARQLPVVLLASGFGSGFSPFAPGTFGSLVGVAIFLFISGLDTLPYLAVIIAITIIGIPISSRAEAIFGKKDSGKIVIDEIAGQLITYFPILGMSFTGETVPLILLLSGFLLFRFFDIVKPPPVKSFENLKGGAGVMLDDVVAGLYALISVYGVELILHAYFNL